MWKQVSIGAAECCRTLWAAGYEAYPVGGCVRDLLLGRTPGDWDVTTNARPEQVMGLFEHTVATGVKHGTVTVVFGREAMEVTTFRAESGYSDGRRPDVVRFDATLEEDLSRRDFTINAMALAQDGSVIDLFGGRADLERGVLCCVGQPERRFGEDGLRMFRAVRFAAQLGFELTQETEQAIRTCAAGAAHIAAERIRVEVEKTLCSDRPERAADFLTFGLMGRGEVPSLPLTALRALPKVPVLRWAGFCAGLDIRGAGAFLDGLRMERKIVQACDAGETLWREGLPCDAVGWRRALAHYGELGCRAAAAMGQVCGQTEVLAALERVLEDKPCVHVSQLALSGGDLAGYGLRGEQIGAAQRYLLDRVLACPKENTKPMLGQKLKEFLAR